MNAERLRRDGNGLPLEGVRVVDLCDGVAAASTRFLADLGADVLLVEPSMGVPSRSAEPMFGGSSLGFVSLHRNKRSAVVDLDTWHGRAALLALTDDADMVVESFGPGCLEQLGVGQKVMRERNNRLVVVSVTDFGQWGPYRDWRGHESVWVAMSSALTRSGAAGREPLLPPGDFGGQTAAIQVAYAALLALWRSFRTGRGDYVDCSLFDLVVQGLDPGYGMAGTAAAGRPIHALPPGRPDTRMSYPIIPCSDGHVRICILAPRQWLALYQWLGEPPEFADPSFSTIGGRFRAWDTLGPAIRRLFAPQTRASLVTEGTRRGLPIAGVQEPREVLDSHHAAVRHAFASIPLGDGRVGRIPNGCVEFDGIRAGVRDSAPAVGQHRPEWSGERIIAAGADFQAGPQTDRPLAGIRVLDLGVIVAGAETGRLLADQGADVIKVENSTYPDGARQGDRGAVVGYNFSLGNRGKRSLGLNLRDDRGREIFRRLVVQSDVVLTNFKPGTLESLGLDHAALMDTNPAIIVLDSSAFGNSGPWSKRMGYGPLVRATVGLTALWRHPDDEEAFGDDLTIYPDHAVARVAAAAVVAALLDAQRTGRGRQISVSQMETVLMQMSTEFLRESVEPGSLIAQGNDYEFDAPGGVFTCQGEDAYLTVLVDGDNDWQRLTEAIGRPDLRGDPELNTRIGRIAQRGRLNAALAEWTAPQAPRDAATRLQAAGIAAAHAAHVPDLTTDPHLTARRQFTVLPQHGRPQPLHAETGPALFETIASPDIKPAPALGEHTAEICHDLLDLDDAEIGLLAAAGVLEIPSAPATEAQPTTLDGD